MEKIARLVLGLLLGFALVVTTIDHWVCADSVNSSIVQTQNDDKTAVIRMHHQRYFVSFYDHQQAQAFVKQTRHQKGMLDLKKINGIRSILDVNHHQELGTNTVINLNDVTSITLSI